MNSDSTKGLNQTSWDQIVESMLIIPTLLNNFFRTAPESILFGALGIALFTQNMAFFFVAIANGIFRLLNIPIGKFFLETMSPEVYEGEGYTKKEICSFPNPTMRTLERLNSTLGSSAVPSSSAFVFLATLFYCLGAMNEFSHELNSLKEKNPVFGSILPVSLFSTIVLSILYIIWRKKHGCDSSGILLTTLVAAGLLGYLLSWAFSSMFGKGAINLLNLPILARDTVIGDKIGSCKS
jgi:hypothetical protein